MKKLICAAAVAAVALSASPALAGEEGKIEVKVLATGVLPDGKIDTINSAAPAVAAALGASPDTQANDNVVPTLAIEYYATPAVSIETICCFTKHKVTGTGSIAGADIARDLLILPATVTVKLHMDAGPVRPYVGAGPALFFYFSEKPGAVPVSLGATSLKMDNKLGFALQAGFDVPVNTSGMGITFDAKKYYMKATTHFYAGTTEVLSTTHDLDPWVLSGGVYFRF
jgi:outer membrane protein